MMEKLTREQFEAEYAKRSGLTAEGLAELGMAVQPCDCDYAGCQGWQMGLVPGAFEKLMAGKGVAVGRHSHASRVTLHSDEPND